MTSPETKTNLMPWQWALIGSGSTVILALAGLGLWNLVASKSPSNSSTSGASNTNLENITIKRLVGQWQQKDSTRLIFTPEGKLFVIPSNSNEAIESRYQVNDATQPNQLTILTLGNQISRTVIFDFISDNQLRIDKSASANSREFSSNTQLFQKVSDVTSLPLGIALVGEEALLKQANKAKESEAKQYVGAMNRAQQAFFLENNQFGSDLDKLGLGIKSNTENYT